MGLGNAQKARLLNSQALACYQQALQVLGGEEKKKKVGRENAEAISTLRVNIALVHMQEGDMESAERMLRLASMHCSKSISGDILHNLSCCLFSRGKQKEAMHAMRMTLKLRTEDFGAGHLLTGNAAHDLANILLALSLDKTGEEKKKRRAEAMELLYLAKNIRLRFLGGKHPDTLQTEASIKRGKEQGYDLSIRA